MKRLDELRSLVALARKFGQEPANVILDEIAALEIDEARQLKREAEIRNRVAEDLNTIFEGVNLEPNRPIPVKDVPGLSEAIHRGIEAGVFEIKGNAEPAAPEVPAATQQPSNVDKVAKVISEQGVVAPDPVLARPQKNLELEIRRLDKWISRIAAAGPGSGEVWFRRLNDVNRGTMEAGNDNWVLEYDAATQTVKFTNNVGPIESLKFDTSGTTQTSTAGMVAWNPAEDCLDIHHYDGSILQAGLEQHIRVFNNTSSVLLNGHLAYFNDGSFYNNDEVPYAGYYIANGTCLPLNLAGIMTNDIAPGQIGRVTTFGKVRGINTTGSEFGETWTAGDILWASPVTSGHLTRVQPTAPYDAVKIGQVLRVGTTSGVILVKPVVFPRLHYGTFSSTVDQFVSSNNTAIATTFNTTGATLGFHIHSSVASRIVAEYPGLFNYQFSLQFISSSASQKNVWIWYRKNGADVSNTATRVSIQSNGGYIAPAWNFIESMEPGNYFELMWATDDASAVKMDNPGASSFCPAIPSALLTVSQVNL